MANEQSSMTVEANIDQISAAVTAQLIAKGTFEPARKRQKNHNWENEMAREYIEKFYSDRMHWYRIEVGEIPDKLDDPIYTKVRRWADAIVVMPDHVLIIELKMIAKPEVTAQLANYIELFRETPMFQDQRELPVKGRVVCALVDEKTKSFIERGGFEVEVYKPANFDLWYSKKIAKTG